MFRAQNLKDDIADLIQIKKYPGVILGLSFVALVKLHEKFGCQLSRVITSVNSKSLLLIQFKSGIFNS